VQLCLRAKQHTSSRNRSTSSSTNSTRCRLRQQVLAAAAQAGTVPALQRMQPQTRQLLLLWCHLQCCSSCKRS
jgi:hypothetical protein